MCVLQNSIQQSSQKTYALPWRRWCTFLSIYHGFAHNGHKHREKFLLRHAPTNVLVWLLAMFTTYLGYEVQLAAKSVASTLSALAYHFRCAVCSTQAFTDPILTACKHALVLDPARQPRSPKRALPLTLAMVEYLLRKYNGSGCEKGMRMYATTVVLAFCCLLRPSEYCRTRSDSHVLRAQHVWFQCQLSDGSLTFRTATQLHGISFSQVKRVKFILQSAKNISFYASRTMWFSSICTTPSKVNLCKIVFRWAQHAHLRFNDFFLSFRESNSTDAIRVSYRKLSSVIKEAALHYGFEPAFFSCYSTRIGGASLLRAAGADDGFILMMGRWKSLPVCLGYQDLSSEAMNRMLKMLTSQHLFSAEDIRLAATQLPVIEQL